MSKEILWDNHVSPKTIDANRKLQLARPCHCGSCQNGKAGVGYISGSVDGEGFTIWIESEETYQRVKKVFEKQGLIIE